MLRGDTRERMASRGETGRHPQGDGVPRGNGTPSPGRRRPAGGTGRHRQGDGVPQEKRDAIPRATATPAPDAVIQVKPPPERQHECMT